MGFNTESRDGLTSRGGKWPRAEHECYCQTMPVSTVGIDLFCDFEQISDLSESFTPPVR